MSGVASEEHETVELAAACYRDGSARFPLVSWNLADFTAACRARWRSHSISAVASAMGGSDGRAEEMLIAACLAGRPGAAAALEREYIAKVAPRMRKLCKSADVADDALQTLREKLLLPPAPRLAQYENRGQLAAWLTIVAVRTALDTARRAQQAAVHLTELDEELALRVLSPESQLATRQLDDALRLALAQALGRLPEHQRFALKMQLVAGWSIDQIGRALSAHRATAARWLVAAREQLERDVREALSRELGLGADEVNRALGALQSRLDLHFSQFFRSSLEGGT